MRCPECDGEGVVWFICKRTNSWYAEECPECHGDGEVEEEASDENNIFADL